MMRMLATLVLRAAVVACPCLADGPHASPPPTSDRSLTVAARNSIRGKGDLAGLGAYQAVREGNRRLTQGNPGGALDAYRHAEALDPTAREIAFVEGLARFDRKEYDQAREAFRKAGELGADRLADDALYSLATCDHTEAIEKMDQPQLALSLLENAMGRYQEVLARQPEHKAARNGNFKAASMWKELKRQLERQAPQPSDSCDNPQEQDGDEKEKEKKQSQQSQDEQPQDQEQQNRPSDQQQEEQPEQQEQEQEQSASSQQSKEQQEKQEQQSAQASEEEQQQRQQAQQAQPEQQEQVSREQAERQLREMMQSVRDRRAMRRVPVQKVPVTPVDKDW